MRFKFFVCINFGLIFNQWTSSFFCYSTVLIQTVSKGLWLIDNKDAEISLEAKQRQLKHTNVPSTQMVDQMSFVLKDRHKKSDRFRLT